jgi:hypothetical protein
MMRLMRYDDSGPDGRGASLLFVIDTTDQAFAAYLVIHQRMTAAGVFKDLTDDYPPNDAQALRIESQRKFHATALDEKLPHGERAEAANRLLHLRKILGYTTHEVMYVYAADATKKEDLAEMLKHAEEN